MNTSLPLALDQALFEAPATLFQAIAAAHDFDLKHLTPAEGNRLDGFLTVAEQAAYPACATWPEKVFLSAKLSCKIELQRAKQAHDSRCAAVQ